MAEVGQRWAYVEGDAADEAGRADLAERATGAVTWQGDHSRENTVSKSANGSVDGTGSESDGDPRQPHLHDEAEKIAA